MGGDFSVHKGFRREIDSPEVRLGAKFKIELTWAWRRQLEENETFKRVPAQAVKTRRA